MNRDTLVQATGEAAGSFADGELAFLALTSMIERPLFDRLSFRLHQLLEPDGFQVAREWPIPAKGRRAADICILSRSGAVAIVEGKATHSSAPTRKKGTNVRFTERMQADLDRLRSAAIPQVDIYCLLLATHPKIPVPEHLGEIVKYPKRINSAFKSFKTESAIREFADRKVCESVVPAARCGSGSVHAGTSLGIPVDVLWWLFGPFRSPHNLTLRRAKTPRS